MYHDQGHIALKTVGFDRAVNVTLGLPIVRTSVAHGTAFDIAWKGLADPSSLIEAVRVAARIVAGTVNTGRIELKSARRVSAGIFRTGPAVGLLSPGDPTRRPAIGQSLQCRRRLNYNGSHKDASRSVSSVRSTIR